MVLGAGPAAVAGLVSIIGTYGLLSFMLNQRRRETGVRMVPGAGRTEVQRLHLGMGLRRVGWGLLGGLALTFFSTRWIKTQLFGVQARDPLTLIGAVLVYLAAGALASYLPARAASRVDPARVMRAG